MADPQLLDIQAFVCGAETALREGGTLAGPAISGAGGIAEWLGIAGLALGTSTALLVFLYMLSGIFRNENAKAFVKFELYELITTTVLVIFILVFVGGLCDLKVGGIYPVTDPAMANKGIYQSVQDQFEFFDSMLEGWMVMNHIVNMQLDQMSATTYSRPLGVGIVTSPLVGLASPFKQITYNVTVGLSIAVVINDALLLVFEFSIVAFLKYYMPIGIVLRSFTPTRRIGGSIIAIGVGFLIIFPLTVVTMLPMFFDPQYGSVVTFDQQLRGYWNQTDITGKVQRSAQSFGLIGFLDFLAGGFIGNIGDLLENLLGAALTALFLIPLSTVALAFAIGYLIPAFNLMILIQAIKHMGKSIGEEIDITSLTRMI